MSREVLIKILDLARWAPSGDNTQPWRFELVDHDHLAIHALDTRSWCVYDLDGKASYMAHGALLENISIAASLFGLATSVKCSQPGSSSNLLIAVRFIKQEGLRQSPLAPFIKDRCVQRSAMSTCRIAEVKKHYIESCIGPKYHVLWHENWRQRLMMAKLMFHNAKVRLICPEAYNTHKRIIEWGVSMSQDKIPEEALGSSKASRLLMKFALADWQRILFLNRFLAGTVPPRIELDFIPGLRCGAHAVLIANEPPKKTEDFIAAGSAMQRMWLAATAVGLQLQPEMTPVIFARFIRDGIDFSADQQTIDLASKVYHRFRQVIGELDAAKAIFICRLGEGKKPTSRSTRLPLEALMV